MPQSVEHTQQLILTVDPGTEQSAYLLYDADATAYPLVAPEYGILPNQALRNKLRSSLVLQSASICVIEKIEHYGLPAGESIFATCIWIGRFIEAWGEQYALMPRREVKQHLCRSARATDATIRQALLDLYGGEKQAVGIKNKKIQHPGPLYGISKDVWSCLALSVTYAAHATGGACMACGWNNSDAR